MNHPSLDALFLTEDEYQLALSQVRHWAYLKWLDAGRPVGKDKDFWLEAETEWVESQYVPERYADEEELHKIA